MISSQFSGGGSMVSVDSEGNNMKNMNGLALKNQNVVTSGKCLVGNGIVDSSSSTMGGEMRSLGHGNGLSSTTTGIKAAMGNNSGTLLGRTGMPLLHHDAVINHRQQEFTNQLMGLEL
ncbi:hypothetical protein P3X46_018327 [Hevea brasiliensis]|uniref:Uncharacterized protein n=1 Tax=Hevea brasiliensis TaxID=3981 RepID=A0ABQ9LQC4_HEVBR|nr:hypothetical protein P3X46_018327 [Hevea brasiliensis]